MPQAMYHHVPDLGHFRYLIPPMKLVGFLSWDSAEFKGDGVRTGGFLPPIPRPGGLCLASLRDATDKQLLRGSLYVGRASPSLPTETSTPKTRGVQFRLVDTTLLNIYYVPGCMRGFPVCTR